MSIWESVGFPSELLAPLFLFFFVCLASYFFDDMDFGFLKFPRIPPKKKKPILLLGACGLAVFVPMAVLPGPNSTPVSQSKVITSPLNPDKQEVFYRSINPETLNFDPSILQNYNYLENRNNKGELLFIFESDIFGILKFPESRLAEVASSIASEELKSVKNNWPDLSNLRQSSLALGQISFKQKNYSASAAFYNYALMGLDLDNNDFKSARGMTTAGYYGAGEHRRGLKFICDHYKQNPNRSARYRHAVHAHIRRIALSESFVAAERVIDFLREEFECKFDDFTYAWIPIPLGFMEGLERGFRFRISINREERILAEKYVFEKRPYSDYILLMLGNLENSMKILDSYPNSFIRDQAILLIAKTLNPLEYPNYARNYIRSENVKQKIEIIMRVARQINANNNSVSIKDVESFFQNEISIIENEEFVNEILTNGPSILAIELAKKYLKEKKGGVNNQIASRVVLGKMIEDGISPIPSDIMRSVYIEEEDSVRSIFVLSFRRSCQNIRKSLESFQFSSALQELENAHRNFSKYHGNTSYEVKTWLDLKGARISLPCASLFGTGKSKILGSDVKLAISYLNKLSKAVSLNDVDTLSTIAIQTHDCHIQRLTGRARNGRGLCGALSRVFSVHTGFGNIAIKLHDYVYKIDPDSMHKHLFLGALAARRNGDYLLYLKHLQKYISSHRYTYLIDDAYAEIGWYYVQTDDLASAEFYLRHVLDHYENLNAYDNALYWLDYVYKKRERQSHRIANAIELGVYLLGRRQIEKIQGSASEIRRRTPLFNSSTVVNE